MVRMSMVAVAALCFAACGSNHAPRVTPASAPLDADFSMPGAFRNPVVAQFTIEGGASSLRSDGQGPYVHRRESVIALIGDAASLWTWRGSTTGDNHARADVQGTFPKRRYLTLDLSHPVSGSGAISLGIVSDSISSIHMFFREDTALHQIIGIWKAPLQANLQDDRVEFWVRTGGHQYLLQFGPWGMGKYSPRGRIGGEGTSAAIVTRPDSARWIVRSANLSVGRLWNVDDVQNPRDAGLYSFSFAFVVDAARGSPP